MSPPFWQASACRRMERLYSAVKRRRCGLAMTSESGSGGRVLVAGVRSMVAPAELAVSTLPDWDSEISAFFMRT